jgi:hypothetical protein
LPLYSRLEVPWTGESYQVLAASAVPKAHVKSEQFERGVPDLIIARALHTSFTKVSGIAPNFLETTPLASINSGRL